MSKENITAKVHEIISEAMIEKKAFNDDDSFFSIGINSVAIMKVQVELANEYKVKLKFREISKNSTVNKLSEFLEQKIQA